jgi:hypothetical protein
MPFYEGDAGGQAGRDKGKYWSYMFTKFRFHRANSGDLTASKLLLFETTA